MEIFFRGLLIGFSIAAPVGPIGVLCIRRTLAEGRLIGLLTGLGAASADALYAAIAAYGLTVVTTFLVGQQTWIHLVGGFFLVYLGMRTIFAPPAEQASRPESGSLIRAYSSTFFLTITNPITIISFAAIFAGLGLGSVEKNYFSATVTVIAVFLGSAAWWLLLSGGVSLLRERVTVRVMRWVNRISGIVILGFALRKRFTEILDYIELKFGDSAKHSFMTKTKDLKQDCYMSFRKLIHWRSRTRN